MLLRPTIRVLVLTLPLLLLGVSVSYTQITSPDVTTSEPMLDVPFVATPHEVVDAMLKVAKVTKDDVVYDLGCGDGRIVIAAAKNYGARGVGIDLNPQRIKEAVENARQAGVEDRVEFRQQDLFETNLSPASVVTLYLLPSVNEKLRPKLLSELKPGSRVVSHNYDMGDWEPQKTLHVQYSTVYFWIIPEKLQTNN